jgi:hypothetical protein
MATSCEYFVAMDDDEAGQTASWAGGPSKPSAAKSGFFRKKDVAPVAAALPTVELPGVEPVVMLATLEELLTGASADEVLEANADAQIGDGKHAMVFRLRQELTDELAGASSERLRDVAGPWSQTEEFFGSADPGDLADALRRLCALALTARESGGRVYCWMET